MNKLLLLLVVAVLVYVIWFASRDPRSEPEVEGLKLYERQLDTARGVEAQMQRSLEERMREDSEVRE